MKQSPQKISMLFISALFSMDVLSNEPIYPIEKKNLLGFVNYTGDIVVKPQFDTGVVHFIGTGRDDLININKDGKRGILGEFKHEVRQFQKPYDNQQAEQISLMV